MRSNYFTLFIEQAADSFCQPSNYDCTFMNLNKSILKRYFNCHKTRDPTKSQELPFYRVQYFLRIYAAARPNHAHCHRSQIFQDTETLSSIFEDLQNLEPCYGAEISLKNYGERRVYQKAKDFSRQDIAETLDSSLIYC